jgi:SAM-dependent methyltransferase
LSASRGFSSVEQNAESIAVTKPNSDSSFTDDVAKFYESTLVPLIFEPYAKDLAARTRALDPDSVLEIACGTGVVTRALASALSENCTIEATDLNQAMISHGELVGTNRPVTWRQANVMALPYDDDIFDVAVCQFAFMFFPDRVAAYREIRRVLRPGGTLLFNMWNAIEQNEFAHVVTEAMSALYPDDPPAFLARTPYGHGTPAEIEIETRAGGFGFCELNQRDEVSSAANPELAAIAYCQGTPLRNEIETRDPGGLERATTAATKALGARFGDGPVQGKISAVVVAARG